LLVLAKTGFKFCRNINEENNSFSENSHTLPEIPFIDLQILITVQAVWAKA
jgi:hypothetical protein